MTEWIGLALDVILICVVGAGVMQAIRLINQLRDLRSARSEMERFVREFNGAVIRAEAGIKGLRAAARDSGDDLEKLVEKAVMIRDELNFIVESADSVAERLSNAASTVLSAERANLPREEAKAAKSPDLPSPPTQQGTKMSATKPAEVPAVPSAAQSAPSAQQQPASRAEKELLQALQKLS
jgi:hypothetical protein